MIFNWLKQSVSRVLFPVGLPLPGRWPFIWVCRYRQPQATNPEARAGQPLTPPYLVLLLTGFTWHLTSPPDPVSSYLTLSPLPAVAGGLLSVALIPGVTPAGRYPASRPLEPGLSSTGRTGSGHLDYFNQTLGCAHRPSVATRRSILLINFPRRVVKTFARHNARPLLLLEFQNQYALAMRAGQQLFILVQIIIQLRW